MEVTARMSVNFIHSPNPSPTECHSPASLRVNGSSQKGHIFQMEEFFFLIRRTVVYFKLI